MTGTFRRLFSDVADFNACIENNVGAFVLYKHSEMKSLRRAIRCEQRSFPYNEINGV